MSPSCYLSCVPNFSFLLSLVSCLFEVLCTCSCWFCCCCCCLKKDGANDETPYMHKTISNMLFLYYKHLSFPLWSLFRFLNINGAGEGKLLFPWNYFNGYNSTSRGRGEHTRVLPGGLRSQAESYLLYSSGRLRYNSAFFLGSWLLQYVYVAPPAATWAIGMVETTIIFRTRENFF